jgi:hypothetical protein
MIACVVNGTVEKRKKEEFAKERNEGGYKQRQD